MQPAGRIINNRQLQKTDNERRQAGRRLVRSLLTLPIRRQ